MQKVYLLLRNNHQSGPYTIDELLQQHLMPTDLVWVNGRSLAWSYPPEVPELKTLLFGSDFLSKASPVQYQLVSSSNPDEIEQRAEALRQQVMSFKTTYYSQKSYDKIRSDGLYAMDGNSIEFIDHRKKEGPLFEWMSGVSVMLIVVFGVYGGQRFFATHASGRAVVSTQVTNIDNHAAKIIESTSIPQPNLTAYQEPPRDTIAIMPGDRKQADNYKRRISRAVEARPATIIEKLPIANDLEENTALNTSQMPDDEHAKKELAELEPKLIVAVEPEEKKKSLGQVFKGLFKKKKKAEMKVIEDEPKAETTQEN